MGNFRPIYETKFGQAYCMDSLEFMKTIGNGTIDLVITSPPYALHFKKEYGNANQDEYVSWFRWITNIIHERAG